MKHSFFIILCISIISGTLWYIVGKNSISLDPREEDSKTVRQEISWLTNPLLECENNGSFAKQKYMPFEKPTLARIENEVIHAHSGVEISVYFRNLNNGPWFGIEEEKQFLPASLMKVTILISYMKWWEDDPTLLDKKIQIREWVWLNQFIPPEKNIEIGKEYSIRDLLYAMISYSDNTASKALIGYIPKERQNKTFIDLGIPLPSENPNYSLSVKEYASFFRILYNASYLSRKSSEEALKILSSSVFGEGIRKEIPESITIAHKFWEREVLDTDGKVINQLHDCGIVYDPSYPYLVCVMTRGKDTSLETLSSIISETSGIIFSEVNKRFQIQ